MNKEILLVILFTCLGGFMFSQEICNDGIDNDSDNLIDLNDSDCACSSEVPTGLIPNPSFELMNCCPDRKEELNCADYWIQASAATTDYVHTCGGFLGHPDIPNSTAPLPFPDGNGAIGFRDGLQSISNYKEYTGAILTESLVTDNKYRMNFFIGFPNRQNANSIVISLYGAPNATSLPFNGTNCPGAGNGWNLIAQQTVTGVNEWVNVVFDFIPSRAYEAIILGPGCGTNPNSSQQPYFFLDQLSLDETSSFLQPLTTKPEDVCKDALILGIDDSFDSYQWYLDGVAIFGEISNELDLNVNSPVGDYSILFENSQGCFISQDYFFEIPINSSETFISLCEGEFFVIQNDTLIEGTNSFTFTSGVNCDSTVIFNVEINKAVSESLDINICENDSYFINDTTITTTGLYSFVLNASNGCDSITDVSVTIQPNIQQFDLIDSISVNLGEEISISPSFSKRYFTPSFRDALIEVLDLLLLTSALDG